MAKRIWVYTLQVAEVIDIDLYDPMGNPVALPKLHTIYTTFDTNANIKPDGSLPLFHSASGVIRLSEIQGYVDDYVYVSPAATTKAKTVEEKSKSVKEVVKDVFKDTSKEKKPKSDKSNKPDSK